MSTAEMLETPSLIEEEVSQLISQLPRRVPRVEVVEKRLPEYVDHIDNVPKVGALSAEAVVRDYELAARSVEQLGKDLMSMAQKAEAMAKSVMLAVDEINSTAARYREEAKKAFEQIEQAALMTEDVRKTCGELREKLGAQ